MGERSLRKFGDLGKFPDPGKNKNSGFGASRFQGVFKTGGIAPTSCGVKGKLGNENEKLWKLLEQGCDGGRRPNNIFVKGEKERSNRFGGSTRSNKSIAFGNRGALGGCGRSRSGAIRMDRGCSREGTIKERGFAEILTSERDKHGGSTKNSNLEETGCVYKRL